MAIPSALLPRDERILRSLGENLKMARLRRRYSAEIVSERAGINRTTLWNLEKGTSATSIITLLRVLAVYGMEKELQSLANDDLLGRKLQDLGLTIGKRSSKGKKK